MKLGGLGPARLEGLSNNLSQSPNAAGFPWRSVFCAIGIAALSFIAGCAFHYIAFRFAP